MKRFVEVAVKTVYVADKPYTYSVPDGFDVSVGRLVKVPFGKGDRAADGVVLSVFEQEGLTEVKALLSVSHFSIGEKGVALANYIKNRYFCSLFDAFRLLTPAFSGKGAVPVFEKFVELSSSDGEKLEPKSEKQKKVLDFLRKNGKVSLETLIFNTSVSRSVISSLEKKGYINIVLEQRMRIPNSVKNAAKSVERDNELNPAQKKAFDEISARLGSGGCHLLYGVTGSGKTHVFISLVNKVLNEGKSVIILLPEISLTFQVVARFCGYYGEKVALLHSGLSRGEKSDEWERIERGDARVVIGTRSAVFAPVRNLGLIIIDEEQEHTYKSEMSPKYHAREIASYRVANEKALLLLASATPSFESFYKAKAGIIGYSELTERFNSRPLPKVLTVDLGREVYSGNTLSVSRLLAKEIDENLKRGEQTILFMNRRGHSSYIACPKCKYVYRCPNCGISLTFHRNDGKLHCHYCNYKEDLPFSCRECGTETLRYSGTGTQKVEEQLLSLFPGIKILRMDADSVSGKNSRDEILTSFGNGEADILLGTQMITKGLDFPNVTLVGVLNADGLLYSSDFRAYEKTFALVTQVTGRAGRSDKSGRAVVQTFSPSHEVLRFAYKQDYIGFYNDQISLRKSLLYPPFCDICQCVFISETEEDAFSSADRFIEKIAALLQEEENKDIKMSIIKPRATSVPMVDGKSRVRILIKCLDVARTRGFLAEIYNEFIREKENKKVSVSVDMNPLTIL